MKNIIDFIVENKAVIIPFVALMYSELLSLNPKWKSNGIFLLIGNLINRGK